MSYSFSQLKQILSDAGWPASLTSLMAAIGLAESSGNPNAVNHNAREFSVGLWQINLNAHPEYDANSLRDPITNAQAALDVYKQQGITAWGAYTDGRYRKYFPSNENLSVIPQATQKYVAKNPRIPQIILLATGAMIILLAIAQFSKG